MTIEQCYACMGSDYQEVMHRLGKEERMKRLLALFPDEPSYRQLCRALRTGDASEAYRASLALKDICMNTGLQVLFTSVNALSNELRGGITKTAVQFFERVNRDYQATVKCITAYIRS